MRMRMTVLAAIGLLVAGIATAEARPATVVNALNVRSGPGTGYPVVATLPAGAQVNVGGCTGNNWCQVGGGYVSASYLAFGGSRVAVSPGYYDGYYGDPALGLGAFALGVGVGSGWGYWGNSGYYWGGPRYRYWGPGRYYGPRAGYWRGGPGWRGGPAYYRGGAGWRGGPAYYRGGPAYYRGGPGWRGGYAGPRPVMYRPQIGGMRRP